MWTVSPSKTELTSIWLQTSLLTDPIVSEREEMGFQEVAEWF
jgi:hypothetical protein